jgi:hypothetical protein
MKFVQTTAAVRMLPLVLLGLFAGCERPEVPSSSAASPASLQAIPVPDPSKYSSLRDLKKWQNPQLIVRPDGIGLVDLANHEIHILQPDQVPAQLAALPPSAWPYGRVVLVTEVETRNPADQVKADLRKNRGLLVGTLKTMDVQIFLP